MTLIFGRGRLVTTRREKMATPNDGDAEEITGRGESGEIEADGARSSDEG